MAEILDYNPSPNYYSDLVQSQRYARISSFTLESGEELCSFPVAFKTWGVLNAEADNVLVVCHALSGSSDIEDWWRPAIGKGPGFAIDISRFFVFCGNLLGSPYGSASPLTIDPRTGFPYGPHFPQTTVRDDVQIHKLVLDALGVKSVAAVIGGSMGGMATLEWPLCTPAGYVKNIIPIATAAKQSAWGIGWSDVQRSCILNDPGYQGGHYPPNPDGQPYAGLATARQVAMLTYRSAVSFDKRFDRKPAVVKTRTATCPSTNSSTNCPLSTNGYKGNGAGSTLTPPEPQKTMGGGPLDDGAKKVGFSVQSYLQYQGEKFLRRFDANCYLHLIDKMDLHDLARGRQHSSTENDATSSSHDNREAMTTILRSLPPKPLVIGAETDLLFRPAYQVELADAIPEAELVIIPSQDGHDGFLLEFEILNTKIAQHLRALFPRFYEGEAFDVRETDTGVKNSVFGEMESD
ncbi:hypothetical protein VTN02DRAFT_847 [Thermoascus thermophilus]